MAWQAVAEDANRGLLGELESDDLKRIQRELSGAKSQIEERVWSSYNHLLLWDANQGKLKDVALGQLHPSEAKSITSAILALRPPAFLLVPLRLLICVMVQVYN